MYNNVHRIGVNMYDLLVLGLVPGTDIQITFEIYITALLSIVASLLLVKNAKKLHRMPFVIGENSLRYFQQHKLFHR